MSGSHPSLTPTRLQQVRSIFEGALDREPEERDAYLTRMCANDATLRGEVESLLAALEKAGDTWDRPLGSALADAIADGEGATVIGHRIGPYDVTRLIGVGGMGAVYEGTRADDQYHKRVALKFLRRGMDGDLAIRRFRYERQILANLNHRNIASLLDGGVTVDGQPYFVMEYVDGEPITTWCAGRSLRIRERVALFRQVCAAVQHAHQNLVVHRDLKPGNILVTADGTVKLLDFGIAKLLREPEGLDQLPMTQGGVRAFTPEYASPEQVRGRPVAAASDVYSLGVILCELLTGHRPFVLDGKLFADVQRLICEAPAPPPSSLPTDADAPTLGERSVSRVRSELTGDLDAIVLQALRKEPERRYGTAERLSSDLKRFMEGLPVDAQRDRLGYRVGKFVRRRRVEVVAGVLILVFLLGGIVATAGQARRATREQAKAEQVNSFLSTMLSAVDPGYRGRDITVAAVLEQAAKDVDKQKLDPEVEAEIRHTIGQTYYGLGLYDSAETQSQRAFDLRRRTYGLRDARTAVSLSYVVALLEARGEYAKAESLARVGVDIQRGIKPISPNEMGTFLDNLARMVQHQGRLDEALKIQREAVDWRRQATDSAGLAGLTYGANNLAVALTYRGEYAAAESLHREALAIESRIHGIETPNYGEALRGLAGVLDDVGQKGEADSVMRESVRILQKTLGDEHPNYLRALAAFARLRNAAGDARTAAASARIVVNQIGKSLPEGDQTASAATQTLGIALDSLGNLAGADSALRQSLALRRKYLPPEHWAIASSESVLGWHLVLTRRYAEAEKMLLRSHEKIAAARGPTALPTLDAARRLAMLYERMGNTQLAAEWTKKAK